MTVQINQGAGVPEHINLASLLSLQEAGFKDAILCFRGIDEEHVEHLALSDIVDWPAIDVVSINVQGQLHYAVVDGNHRLEAARVKKATTILARVNSYASEAEVIEAAFRANLRNGRAASTTERGEYAIWLYLQDPSEKPNLSAIARKVGLNQSTVSRTVNKWLRECDAEEEAEKSGTSVLEITETQRLLNAIRRYMENETAFFADQHAERSVKKRASSLVNHLKTMKDKTKLKKAIADLQSLTLTLNEISFDGGSQKRKNA